MTPIAPLKMLVAPAAKAITRLGSSMTYDNVPCAVEARSDSCPYFAPKLASDPEQREQ